VRITDVRAFTCDVPVPRPIILGDIRYDSRDYVIVEVLTDEGVSGIGFGMARYAPVAQIVEANLKPLLVGQDPLLTERLWDRMYHLNLLIAQRGIFMRALSAVDIALWDIKGKAAGLPVWRLLGGHSERVPLLMAGGYVARDKTLKDLEAELTGYVERGFRLVKISNGTLAEDTERLRAARHAIGPQTSLIYDAHWSWRDAAESLRVIRGWQELDLAWIEDPFPSELSRLAVRLRSGCNIPIGIGEDLAGRWAFQELLQQRAVDVVRVDVAVVGGFTEAVKVCALAATEGLPVSPHVYPELHVHLAAALPAVMALEMTDPAQGIEGLHLLLKTAIHIDRGEAVAPSAPGLGVDLDMTAVQRYRR
jgi:D-arabinonate dehydratase